MESRDCNFAVEWMMTMCCNTMNANKKVIHLGLLILCEDFTKRLTHQSIKAVFSNGSYTLRIIKRVVVCTSWYVSNTLHGTNNVRCLQNAFYLLSIICCKRYVFHNSQKWNIWSSKNQSVPEKLQLHLYNLITLSAYSQHGGLQYHTAIFLKPLIVETGYVVVHRLIPYDLQCQYRL